MRRATADAMEAYMVRRLRQLSTGLTGGSHEVTQLEQQLSGLSPRVLSLAQQLFNVAEQELGITEHVRSSPLVAYLMEVV